MSVAPDRCPGCGELTEKPTCAVCGRNVDHESDDEESSHAGVTDASGPATDKDEILAVTVRSGEPAADVGQGTESDAPDWRQFRSPRTRGQRESAGTTEDHELSDTDQAANEDSRPTWHYWHTC